MNIPSYKQGLAAAGLVVIAVTIMPFAVAAHTEPSKEEHVHTQEREAATQRVTEKRQQRAEEVQETNTDRREAAKTRLEAAKLRACQNREKAIQNIMARIADRSTKQLAVFTTIAERTQKFYESRGNIVEGYGELIAEVAAKRTNAEAIVATIESSSSEFNCEGDNPKGFAASFKATLQTRNAALKEYKTAVKNLIVGVKSAQSAATESTTEGAE